jgi:colanic acid/amylovoran/stewartan biosynthesis glycosyltransferase WcaL/AmsK/CpsK
VKIAFLTDRFPALSETFIENQILSLLDLGIDVTILASGRGSTEVMHAATKRILAEAQIVYLPTPRPRAQRWLDLLALPLRLGSAWRIATTLRRLRARPGLHEILRLILAASVLEYGQRFDFVFCHFAPNGSFGVWLRDAGLLQGTLLTFCHGYDFSELVQARGPAIFARLFQRGDLFVANTDYTRGRLLEIGAPAARTLKLPVGFYPERFRYRVRYAAPDRPVRFVSIGRLVEKKGHAYALHALRQVLDAGIEARLGIIGEGPQRAELEALIKLLELGEAVTLYGRRSQEEVARLADEADLFVIASTASASGDVEGQGLVLQEAQAMGLPVIATRHNGFPEGMIDGETGLLVPEADIDGLAAGMIELARHPEYWAAMGRAGHAFVRERFDQPRLTGQLLGVLGARPPSMQRLAGAVA